MSETVIRAEFSFGPDATDLERAVGAFEAHTAFEDLLRAQGITGTLKRTFDGPDAAAQPIFDALVAAYEKGRESRAPVESGTVSGERVEETKAEKLARHDHEFDEAMREITANWDGICRNPSAYYSPDGRVVFAYFENVPYYADRQAYGVDLYRTFDTGRVVGCAIWIDQLTIRQHEPDPKREALAAPPLSPATPSAELLLEATRAAAHARMTHDCCPFCEEHADALDAAISHVRAASVTPSVAVEEVERVSLDVALRSADKDEAELGEALYVEWVRNGPHPELRPLWRQLEWNDRTGWHAAARYALSLPRAPEKETSAVEAEVVEAARNYQRFTPSHNTGCAAEKSTLPRCTCGRDEAMYAFDRALARAQEGRGT